MHALPVPTIRIECVGGPSDGLVQEIPPADCEIFTPRSSDSWNRYVRRDDQTFAFKGHCNDTWVSYVRAGAVRLVMAAYQANRWARYVRSDAAKFALAERRIEQGAD